MLQKYLLYLLLFCVPFSLFAQEKRLELSTIVEYALTKSLKAKFIDNQNSEQEASAVNTELLSNPDLGIEYRAPTDYKTTRGANEYQISLSQPLKLSNFGLREKVAKAIREAASVDKKRGLFELSQNIAIVFAKAWGSQELVNTLTQAQIRLKNKSAFVKESMQKGLLGDGDNEIFLAETERIATEALGAKAILKNNLKDLINVSSYQSNINLLAKPSLGEALTVNKVLDISKDSEITPINRAKILLTLAQKQAELANKDKYQSFSPSLFYERTGDNVGRLGFGISFNLPIFNQNNAERILKNAQEDYAKEQNSYYSSNGFKNEINFLVESYSTYRQQAIDFEQKVVFRFQKALTLLEAQYESGKGNIMQVWQSQRELTNVKQRAIELWIQAFLVKSELSILTGVQL